MASNFKGTSKRALRLIVKNPIQFCGLKHKVQAVCLDYDLELPKKWTLNVSGKYVFINEKIVECSYSDVC